MRLGMGYWNRLLLAAACLVCLSGGSFAGEAAVHPLKDLPGWSTDSLTDWRAAWERSCALKPWLKADRGYTKQRISAWEEACKEALPADEAALRQWLESRFEAVPIPDKALITGYYTPRIEARRSRMPPFTTPLYRSPPDMAGIIAKQGRYWSRAEIEQGALAGKGLEIAWADPIDAFFLHIQGSGLLHFPGEPAFRIAYAGNNGHAYRAIGGDLVASGAIAKGGVSMQSIRAWLQAHPDEAPAVMQRNPRYIFFALSRKKGPFGASGAVLTAERSVAIDPAYQPYGLPVWLDVEPSPGGSGERLQRLAVTQDTGKAIRGPARADYFWGSGDEAGQMAGRMKAKGRIYLLLPRGGALK